MVKIPKAPKSANIETTWFNDLDEEYMVYGFVDHDGSLEIIDVYKLIDDKYTSVNLDELSDPDIDAMSTALTTAYDRHAEFVDYVQDVEYEEELIEGDAWIDKMDDSDPLDWDSELDF